MGVDGGVGIWQRARNSEEMTLACVSIAARNSEEGLMFTHCWAALYDD